ncbi:hypothetical protein [Sandaracinus amylolyticus]|uniref:hypothetical protein n=1 Tax=Sandaracinus amylolyticus TaxID=927083 RepID=UPI001F44B1F8|nr:hypothetical protein [Sandaracinus amylolyticus]UJR84772.1 Hypothetical protein I5071_68510 [Sandaracinus amylolyticus]
MRASQRTFVALALMIGVVISASSADAQRRRRGGGEAVDPLTAAEQAYTEVDFEQTLEHAGAALQAGGHAPDRLVRIYMLLGVSAAALGDAEGARDFFQRMLAVDPEAQLDDTVPPRLRAPYLEARGIVSARPEQLGVEVGIARAQSAVRVALIDPFQMARTVRVHGRIEGQVQFTDVEAEAQSEVLAPLAGADTADRIEYWVEVLDPYGNQVVLVGSEFEPRTVGRVAAVAVPGGGGAGGGGTQQSGGGSVLEDPLFWVIAVGVVLVTGGVVAGVLIDQSSHVPVQTGVSFGVP